MQKDRFQTACFLLLMILIAWVVTLIARTEDSFATTSPPAPIVAGPITVDWSGFPQASPVSFPASLEVVVLTPTKEPTPYIPPTPTPSAVPTFICPDDPSVLPTGTVCLGDTPLPTPTVMPSCQTPPIAGIECMVRK